MTERDSNSAPSLVLPAVQRTTSRFTAAVDEFSDAQFLSATRLPEWNRKHLIAHVTNLADALARQVEFAAEGELIEVYDGGVAGRAAGIDASARHSARTQRAELHRAVNRLTAAWPVDPDGWHAPVLYADGTVSDVLLCWWREAAIHLVDLDVGEEFAGFDHSLHSHLWDFLAERLPPGVPVELIGTGGSSSSSSGALRELIVNPATGTEPDRVDSAPTSPAVDLADPLTVTGTVAAISEWLAGRNPSRPPVARAAGEPVSLPELSPWPSRAAKPAV